MKRGTVQAGTVGVVTALGAGVGAALGSVAFGVAFGVGLGAILAVAMRRKPPAA